MRIVNFLPHYPSLEGISVIIREVTRHLRALGVDAEILTYNEEQPHPRHVNSIPNRFALRPFGSPPAGVRECILERRPDLVVVHAVFNRENPPMTRLLRRIGIPFVFVPHGAYSPNLMHKRRVLKAIYLRLIEKPFVLNGARAIQVQDDDQVHFLSEFGVSRPTFNVPNGFDPESVPDDLEQPSDDMVRILYLGRIERIQKGLDLLIEAAALLSDLPNWSIRLVGPDQGDASLIERQISELNLSDRIRWSGPFDGNIYRLIAEYDALVLPSRFEGFPMVALEAMAVGRALLLTEGCGGIVPHVRAANAGLVVQTSGSAISAGLKTLIENNELRLAMGERGSRYAHENLTWEPIVEALLDNYRRLVLNPDL